MRLYSVYLNNLTKLTKALTRIFIKGVGAIPCCVFSISFKKFIVYE